MADEQPIPQTTEATPPPVDPGPGQQWDEASDADLIAAAKEAGGAASVDVNAEAAAAGQPPPKPAEPEAPADEPKIAAVLRAREKAFAERQGAEDFAAQRRAQAQKEADQLIADARKRAADDYERELQARRQKFAESPAAAIRELGWKTDDMVDAVTREGTAEWKAIRAAEERARAAEQKAATVDTIKSDFEQYKQQAAQAAQQQRVQAAEQQFITAHASAEKAPTLHRIAASIPNVPGVLRGDALIVQMGHAIANQWSQAGIPFANSDVAEYLEHQARTGALGAPASASPPQVSGASGGPKVRPANGSRTLSPSMGSERRATPKPIEEMSPEEERQALIEAASEARRQAGG